MSDEINEFAGTQIHSQLTQETGNWKSPGEVDDGKGADPTCLASIILSLPADNRTALARTSKQLRCTEFFEPTRRRPTKAQFYAHSRRHIGLRGGGGQALKIKEGGSERTGERRKIARAGGQANEDLEAQQN